LLAHSITPKPHKGGNSGGVFARNASSTWNHRSSRCTGCRSPYQRFHGSASKVVRALAMSDFQMLVQDTFLFEDGTTVFTGHVQSQINFIRACDCEIVRDGEIKATVHIDGEMRPNLRPGSDPTIRAVSTKENLDLTSLGIGKGGFLLRSK